MHINIKTSEFMYGKDEHSASRLWRKMLLCINFILEYLRPTPLDQIQIMIKNSLKQLSLNLYGTQRRYE